MGNESHTAPRSRGTTFGNDTAGDAAADDAANEDAETSFGSRGNGGLFKGPGGLSAGPDITAAAAEAGLFTTPCGWAAGGGKRSAGGTSGRVRGCGSNRNIDPRSKNARMVPVESEPLISAHRAPLSLG